jgi:ornithine carbamoyltransferase
MKESVRHFLKLSDFTADELKYLLQRAETLKQNAQDGGRYLPFTGQVLAMIFEKASTRTRVSFEAGFNQLGGSVINLNSKDTQLSNNETFEDTARVVSRMVNMIMVRTFDQKRLESFAAASEVPVINGLTNESHPCQIMGDILTFNEKRGNIAGKTVAWIGDANNVLYTWLTAADILDFNVRIYAPVGFKIEAARMPHRRCYDFFLTPEEASSGADIVTTDTWTSSGYTKKQEKRQPISARWQVNSTVMSYAKPEALFMHCLPACRGEEVSAEVIDGPQSVVWEEAANRLHIQKAIMEYLAFGKVE